MHPLVAAGERPHYYAGSSYSLPLPDPLICIKPFRLIIACFLLALPALAQDSADAVNERLPATDRQREEHWQVDCTRSWQSLQRWAADTGADTVCPTDMEHERALTLCSFIYQVPGDHNSRDCPDYRGVLDELARGIAAGDCGPLAVFLRESPSCH